MGHIFWTSKFFHWTTALALIVLAFLAIALSGCQTVASVINPCVLPPALAQKSTPQPEVLPDLTLEAQHRQWATDRGYGAKWAKHSDDIVDYVGGHCQ